jgi:hypothetical protein
MGGIVSAQTDNLITLSKQQIIGDAANEIGDKQFMDDLGKLKELRSFLIEQAVQLKPGEAAAMSFGKLNLLRWRIDGRMPTQEEWTALEGLTQDLFRHLSDPLRRRFLYSRLPWWIPRLVGALGLTAFAALMISIFLWGRPGFGFDSIVPFYLAWVASLGAIGSVSFIGMNALSVQDDATFDVSNSKLLTLRVLLGALFGAVLTLPFGLGGFSHLIESLVGAGANPLTSSAPTLTTNTLILLLPFVLGFSTSLVIMILNQCIDAISVLFGKKSSSPPVISPPPTLSPQSTAELAGRN